MPFGIGVWEIAVLLLVALLVFGPKRLPGMGRSLGRGMREISGMDLRDDDARVAPARDDPAAGSPSRSRDAV